MDGLMLLMLVSSCRRLRACRAGYYALRGGDIMRCGEGILGNIAEWEERGMQDNILQLEEARADEVDADEWVH